MKIKCFQKLLHEAKIDYALLVNTSLKDPNILYLTGYDLEYSFLVVPKNKKPIYFVSALEYGDVKNRNINIRKYKKPLDQIKKIVKGNVAINHKYVTLGLFQELKKWKKCKFKQLDNICKEARIVKTKEEIDKIKKAAMITDKIFNSLRKNIKKCKTETNVAEHISNAAKKYNTTTSFNTIVASGKHAAIPHYVPKNTPIKKGFCIIDFGIRYENYISDMTRTIFIGNPSKEDKKNYEKVLNANLKAIQALKPGTSPKKIDAIARKYAQFPHSLGHGIGIEVHESPSINKKSKEVMKEGMCFTIEPGLYKEKKYGIRIEDDIVLTKNGPIVLTKSTKKLLSFNLNNREKET